MSEINKAMDMFDREILTGDICVYPVRRGSKMWMNRIVIQNIISNSTDTSVTLVGTKQDGYPVRVKCLDRVAIIGRDNVLPFVDTETN